jgi:putative transposase
MLQREGWRCNHKRVYRLCRQEQLAVRRRKRKRLAAVARVGLPVPTRPNERWPMDFMSDTLATSRTFRTLNIVDDASRECLRLEVDYGLASLRVIRVLNELARTPGPPAADCRRQHPGVYQHRP